jgi:hypothetical protein
MPKAMKFTAILIAALMTGPSAALAFQEVPSAPQQELSIPGTGTAEQGGGLTFEAPAAPSDAKPDGRKGLGLGNLEVLPKLDFGLELLYGGPKAEPALSAVPGQPSSTSPADDDVKILGTVKRRF